jgi:hypothetical protein
MSRYMIGGYEEYPVIHLVPVKGDYGVELPEALYDRWRRARAELEAVQRDVVAHLRDQGGREAIPEELWEQRDQRGRSGVPGVIWDSR